MREKKMSGLQVAALLKKGRPFLVHSVRDRQNVLNCASFMGVQVATKAVDGTDSFKVTFF